MDSGDIYYRALSNFGQSVGSGIGDAMEEYHKRHLRYDQALGVANSLSQIGIDEKGNLVRVGGEGTDGQKTKATPIIDPKALELFTARGQSERDKAVGGLEALNRLGLHLTGSAAEALMKARIGETGLAGQEKQARIAASTSRAKLTDVQIAQQLGLIPKTQQPPTGGQIMAEQRAQRKERMNERKAILDELHVGQGDKAQFIDPELLLDDSAIQYVTKGKLYGVNQVEKDKATHVQIEDGPMLSVKEFNRLRTKAQRWQELGKAQQPAPTIRPEDAQKLIQNPTPEMKALFDKAYGQQGLADTVLNAQQPAKTEPPPAEEADTTEENGGGE